MNGSNRLAELQCSVVGWLVVIEARYGGGKPHVAVELVDVVDVSEASAISEARSRITWCRGGGGDGGRCLRGRDSQSRIVGLKQA